MNQRSLDRPALAWPELLVAFLLIGFLCMSRSFAHLGIPPLFVGELSLGLFLVGCGGVLALWYRGLVRNSLLSGIAWLYFAIAAYGAIECLRGIGAGYRPIIALQCMALNVYPLFFFVGAYVGLRQPELLQKMIRVVAWANGLYGILYIVVLSPAGLTASVETEDIGLFGQPYGAAVVLLGLIAYEKRLGRVWFPLMINAIVLLGMEVRAAWVGFALAVPLLALLSGRTAQLFKLGVVIGGLMLVGWVTDLKVPAPKTRGGEISTRAVIGRAIAAFDSKAASQYTDNADSYNDTVGWRTMWWSAIWRMVHHDPLRAAIGPGYGFPIWDLHPDDLGDEPLRTPHNDFMFALGYTGWLGVALFYGLLLAVAALLWKAFRVTGQPFGICYWAMIAAWSCFDNFFEAPYGAIPFFLITGLAAAPLLRGEVEPIPALSQSIALFSRFAATAGGEA